MIPRRVSKQLKIGDVTIGGGAPIRVQSMTTAFTRDVEASVAEILGLAEAGCEIVRVAVPHKEDADALPEIRKRSPIPVIADIHFDYRLALRALEAGVDGLRLNPGNIGSKEKTRMVVKEAKDRQVPMRIGVNVGSLESRLIPELMMLEGDEKIEKTAAAMVESALDHVKILEDMDFTDIKISLKASDVPTTILAYQLIADRVEYPLHLGITEAGTPKAGMVKSAVGLGVLLYQGIGDTLRVSLAAESTEEVFAGYEILKSLGLREHGPTLIACPTCGRCEIELIELAERVESFLQSVKEPVKVAVMGCVVNGPGEARDADVGIAGGRGKGALFRKGKPVRSCKEEELFDLLIEEVDEIVAQKQAERAVAQCRPR